MRILYFTDVRFPIERANGVQTMETAHALARRGHTVHLCVRPDIRRPSRDPFAFYALPVEPCLRFDRAPIAGPHGLRRLEYLGWAAARTFRARTADLIFTRDLGVADVLRRLPLAPPLVYESHGFAPVFAGTLDELVSGARPAPAAKIRHLTLRERRVWRSAAGYVATTAVLVEDLIARFGPRAHVSVITNGVRLPVTPVGPVPRQVPPSVAYAGHLYAWKGVDVLLHALARLPDVRGLIVGGHPREPDMARLTSLASELGISSRVTFAGFLSRDHLPARLAEASVFVLPTLDTPSARYTSPLKMFEYMALERPIVASDLRPVREVLTDGVNARLVPPADAAALATAIHGLLSKPEESRVLAAQARADAEAYSWDRRAERLEQLFADVIEARP